MKRPDSLRDPDLQLADLLVHEAAHAVVAWELGIEILHVRFDLDEWSGRMPFIGAMNKFVGDLSGENAQTDAETDMMIFHAGHVAQRWFNYAGSHGHSRIDLWGLMRTCQWVDRDIPLIDAWSEYIEERTRVFVQRRTTWTRILALAAELPRHGVMSGAAVSAFLSGVRIPTTQPEPRLRRNPPPIPPETSTPRAATAGLLGRAVTDVLELSTRARHSLAGARITTIAELLLHSAWDLRWRVGGLGDKTLAEILEETRRHGLRLPEERWIDRQRRVRSARQAEPVYA